MKRRPSTKNESLVIVSGQSNDIVIDNMCSAWGVVPYPQLSVLLVHLKYLATVHQTHHWTAMGDPFYGDHLLFDRLYGAVNEEIDGVAEKCVGLGTTENVNLLLQATQFYELAREYGMTQTIPQACELVKRSLAAEMKFMATCETLIAMMAENGTLTKGLDNMLSGILDKHEGHVYLLKQRCS
mgnify:CR=1 FL=1